MSGLKLTLGEIARIVGGTLSGDASILVDDVSIDSRKKMRGGLFIAIAGDRFDGHDFAAAAVASGADAVLVHKQIDGLVAPHIRVTDTLDALQKLGARKRRMFRGQVAGITGSCGKTTTRRILATILEQVFPTHTPVKNFNNHIGLPLTLLGLGDRYRAAVLELGCSDFGEIAALAKLADPDVGLVTNVGRAHLEKLHSLDGVAKAKGELFLGMRPDTTAVVNADDPRVLSMPLKSETRITYGRCETADVRLSHRNGAGIDGQEITIRLPGGTMDVFLPLLGAHNATNAVAATAAATAMGVSEKQIADGLATVIPEPGRLCVRRGKGCAIIDDTYNANPGSMTAALGTLKETGGRMTVAVLGDMLELGEDAEAAHLEIGRVAYRSGIDLLVTVGELGQLIGSGAVAAGLPARSWVAASSHSDAAEQTLARIDPAATGGAPEGAASGTVVLVKGSRGMAMEKVVEHLSEVW